MVRKDEPLKVTDLESGEEATTSSSKDQPPPSQTKSKSVFNRLAYGGKKTTPKVAEEQQQHTEIITKPETANKTDRRLTGKNSGKSGGSALILKNNSNSNNKSLNNVEVQQQQQQQQMSGAAGGVGVFDRLTSGERLYRTTQSGRKPAGRRAADQTVDLSTATKESSTSKVNSKSLLPATAANDAGAASKTAMLLADETGNNVTLLSPEREEMDGFNEDEEEDPVIEISLIQPPQAKARSSPRPVLKKSARLLLSQREQLLRRKSWVKKATN
jgi:hypothetical protein